MWTAATGAVNREAVVVRVDLATGWRSAGGPAGRRRSTSTMPRRRRSGWRAPTSSRWPPDWRSASTRCATSSSATSSPLDDARPAAAPPRPRADVLGGQVRYRLALFDAAPDGSFDLGDLLRRAGLAAAEAATAVLGAGGGALPLGDLPLSVRIASLTAAAATAGSVSPSTSRSASSSCCSTPVTSGCRWRSSTSGWAIPASPRRRSAAAGSSCTCCASRPPVTRRWPRESSCAGWGCGSTDRTARSCSTSGSRSARSACTATWTRTSPRPTSASAATSSSTSSASRSAAPAATRWPATSWRRRATPATPNSSPRPSARAWRSSPSRTSPTSTSSSAPARATGRGGCRSSAASARSTSSRSGSASDGRRRPHPAVRSCSTAAPRWPG